MKKTKFIWMDESLVPWKDAKVHVLTHSLHYGSAVFEGIRFYKTKNNSAIFRLKEHTDRLFKSAKSMQMKIPYSKGKINSAIIKTVRANKIKSGYIRPIAFFGYGKMGLSSKGAPVNLSIAVWPWGAYLGTKPVKIKTSPFMRIHPKSTPADSKISGNYVNSTLAEEEAIKKGYDEALLLDFEGNVAEGSGENIFIVKKNKLYTPTLGRILSGITRNSIITIAKNLGIKVQEKKLKINEIYKADEAFFTGTATEVMPIASLDNRKIKNSFGPTTKKLKETYLDIVKGKNNKYKRWLTFIN